MQVWMLRTAHGALWPWVQHRTGSLKFRRYFGADCPTWILTSYYRDPKIQASFFRERLFWPLLSQAICGRVSMWNSNSDGKNSLKSPLICRWFAFFWVCAPVKRERISTASPDHSNSWEGARVKIRSPSRIQDVLENPAQLEMNEDD